MNSHIARSGSTSKGTIRADHVSHVERDGKLCLDVRENPIDPSRAVLELIQDAIRLLRENASDRHVDDFQEDFGLYWLNAVTDHSAIANVYLRQDVSSGLQARVLQKGRNFFIFDSEQSAKHYVGHLFAHGLRKPCEAALIRIHPLPAPDRFPNTGAELWDLVAARSPDGVAIMTKLLGRIPNEAVVVVVGAAPSGREHAVVIRLARPRTRNGQPVQWRNARRGAAGSGLPIDVICSRYEIGRLKTQRMDSAASRLPYADAKALAKCRIAIIGCGALGSGAANLLAKAGVGHIFIVDNDFLMWENIRRHELGAQYVHQNKAEAMAEQIKRSIPDIGSVTASPHTLHSLLAEAPKSLEKMDIVISCTGSWGADVALEDHLRTLPFPPLGLYSWLEANAVAAHAVLLDNDGPSLRDGFDGSGEFRLPATSGGKPAPPECGGSTSPFGAIELLNAQALVARLALDALRGKVAAPLWRTWLTDNDALAEAGATWSEGWLQSRGAPPQWGGIVQSPWAFP